MGRKGHRGRKERRGQNERGRRKELPPFWFGAIFVLTGLAIMALGGGLIPVDPDSVHAPGWVIVLCGVVFALGGVAASLDDEHAGHRALGELFGFLMIAAFATICSWIAFGPGERQFSGGASGGGVGVSGSVGSTFGRIVFGFGAAMLWLLTVGLGSRMARRVLGRGD